MSPSAQSTGWLALACSSPLWAGGLGAVLGLAAAGLGAQVARRSHAAGLRAAPPPPPAFLFTEGLAPGLTCAALAWWLADPWLLAGALGVVWGYCAAELANHVRAQWTLAGVVAEADGLAQWQALPAGLRGRLVLGQVAGTVLLLLVAAVITLQPVVMGLALGAVVHLSAVARAARSMAAAG